MPETTRNKKMEDYAMRFGKPLILVMNKADLISGTAISNMMKYYSGTDYAIVSSTQRKGIGRLIGLIKTRTKKEEVAVAIIGYPNTGKSSLINRLSKGGRARTSPESGFTKGLQLISGRSGFKLFDTPGVVPYEARDEARLGLVSGISPSKLEDPELVAYDVLDIFKRNNPSALESVYGIPVTFESDTEELLIALGKKWNMLQKGSTIDERRAAIHLLNDWHSGKIKL